MHDRAGHALAELMRAEARAADAAERGVHLAHLKLADRLDRDRVGHVEREDTRMRPPAPRLLLAGALRLVLLVDRERDATALDAVLERHHGVGRLREQRMIIVAAEAPGLGELGHVDDPEAGVPATRPHLVAEAQRMMQPVIAPGPGRRLAASDVLPRHPPAPN